MKIDYAQLIDLLNKSRGAVIVGLLTNSDARAKTNPFGEITKRVRIVGITGGNYQNSVIREGQRQGIKDMEFEGGSLPWGVWYIFGKVISHKGEWYLRLSRTPNARISQPERILGYRGEDGRYLSYETIQQYLPKIRQSEKQQAAGLQSTVFIRNYKFSSILKIRLFGKTYELENSVKPIKENIEEIKKKLNTPRAIKKNKPAKQPELLDEYSPHIHDVDECGQW